MEGSSDPRSWGWHGPPTLLLFLWPKLTLKVGWWPKGCCNIECEFTQKIITWEAITLASFCVMGPDEATWIEGHGIGRLEVWFQMWYGDSLVN